MLSVAFIERNNSARMREVAVARKENAARVRVRVRECECDCEAVVTFPDKCHARNV